MPVDDPQQDFVRISRGPPQGLLFGTPIDGTLHPEKTRVIRTDKAVLLTRRSLDDFLVLGELTWQAARAGSPDLLAVIAAAIPGMPGLAAIMRGASERLGWSAAMWAIAEFYTLERLRRPYRAGSLSQKAPRILVDTLS